MATHAKTNRSRRGLLAACVAALLLVLFLSVFETRERGLSCAALAPVSAEDSGPESIDGSNSSTLSPPAEEPVVAPTKPSGERVAGRVVDKRSRDGVPWITVEVRAGEVRSLTKTDEGGMFASSTSFVACKIEVEVTDEGSTYGVTKLDWTAVPNAPQVEIPIDIGPTILADSLVRGMPSLDDHWRLRLVQSVRPVGSAGEIDVRDEELSMAGGADLDWSVVALRMEGDATTARQLRRPPVVFARWPRVEFEPKVGFLPRVRVQSDVRFVRGLAAVEGSTGTQYLPNVALERFRHVTGRVTGRNSMKLPNVHILWMTEPRDLKNTLRAPDVHEVVSPDGSLSLDLYGKHNYIAVAWAQGFEPAIWRGGLASSELSTFKDLVLQPLTLPSFTPSSRVLTPDLEATDARQFVRARPIQTGSAARAALYEWPGASERSTLDVMATRYQVEVIGVDRTPQTHGRTWQQVLPGDLAPDPLSNKDGAVPHRIEWIDPVVNAPRFDFQLTAGPAGCIVTTKETAANTTFALIPKSPMQFTVWHGGSEPIQIEGKDFADRHDECVANIQPQPGWGVLIAFRVVDSVEKGAARGEDAQHAYSLPEILSLPPLPGVLVTSITGDLGASDADGCLLVRSRLWPPRLSLRAEGYRLSSLQRMSGPGSRWIAFMEHDR